MKLHEFHRADQPPLDQSLRDLNEALVWLPESAYAEEAEPLAQLAG